MTLNSLRQIALLLLVTVLPLAGTLRAQKTIVIGGEPRSITSVKQSIEEYRKLVPEKEPNEVQLALGKRIDYALNKLSQLVERMNRVGRMADEKAGFDREIQLAKSNLEFERKKLAEATATEAQARRIEADAEKAKASAEATDAGVALMDRARQEAKARLEQVIGTAIEGEKTLNQFTGEAQAADQKTKDLEADDQRLAIEKDARDAAFNAVAQALDGLANERKNIEAEATRDDISPERRQELEFDLLRIEVEIRGIEYQRDNHTILDELGQSARTVIQAKLEEARVQKQRADLKLGVARRLLEMKREEEQRAAAIEAAEKQKEAEQASLDKQPARSAMLKLQGMALEIGKLKIDEEDTKIAFAKKSEEWANDLKRGIERDDLLNELLPENEELTESRVNLLVDELSQLSTFLPAEQTRLADLTREVVKSQGKISKKRIDIDALKARLDSQIRQLDKDEGGNYVPLIRSDDNYLAQWTQLKREWDKGLARANNDLQNGTENAVSAATLQQWQAEWNTAEKQIGALLRERKKILDDTGPLAREALASAEKYVEILVGRSSRLDAMTFWIQNDGPLSRVRREQMAAESGELINRFSKNVAKTMGGLRDAWRGPLGIAGIGAVLLGIALALFRRTRADPSERIERLVAKERDPLLEFGVVIGWLAFETGHHLLFALGLCLVWQTPIPDDPIACAIQAIILIAALRLAAVRLVSYLSEASHEVDQMLALEARRFMRWAVIGFLVTVPPMFYFERAAAPALAEVARLLATVWAFVLVIRLNLRSHLLWLLVPTRESSSISRSLRGFIRGAWPLVGLFVGAIVFLQYSGYQNASEFLIVRSLMATAFMVTLSVVYQFAHAFIESRTTSVIEQAESLDQTQEFMTRARQRQLEVFNQMFSMPLLIITLVGGVVGIGAIFDQTGVRLQKLSAAQVFSEARDKDGIIIPGLTWGDVGIAILIFLCGYVIARIVRDLIVVGIGSPHDDRRGGRFAVGTLVFYVLMTFTIVFGLRTMKMNLADYGWLLGTAGVAIGFGLTQILSNFVSGLILFVERPVQVGDIVTIGDVEGDVRKISIRSTIVRTRDGVSIILPNRKLIEEDVVNWSHSDPKTRLHIEIGVAYGSDVPLVKRILLELAEKDGRLLKRPRPEVDFRGFGESELSFQILAWVATPDITIRRRIRSDMHSAIDAAFRRHGVEIPFPQRDLHIRDLPRSIAERQREKTPDDAPETAGNEPEGGTPEADFEVDADINADVETEVEQKENKVKAKPNTEKFRARAVTRATKPSKPQSPPLPDPEA